MRAATAYTKDTYARAIRRGVDKANKAIVEQAEEFQIENPVAAGLLGTEPPTPHAAVPKCGGATAWRPRRSSWATPRPT